MQKLPRLISLHQRISIGFIARQPATFANVTVSSSVPRFYSSFKPARPSAVRQRPGSPPSRPQRIFPAPASKGQPSLSESTDPTPPVVVPVEVPKQPNAVLDGRDPASTILLNSALLVSRQFEMLNIFLGFEQANKYAIMDPEGNPVGFLAEEESFFTTITRQLFRTHRAFNATVMDTNGNVIFKIRRPFAWINSYLYMSTANDIIVGEVHQEWHLWRRKYNLFVDRKQYARIDEPFLSWDFTLEDEDGGVLGSVNKNFLGFGREIFTDTSTYAIRFDAAEGHVRGMTLDERAIALASAISIDFDYFSRHSERGGAGFLPFALFGGNDE